MDNKKIIVRKVLKKDLPLLAKYLSEKALPKYPSNEYIRRFNFWWLKNPAFSKHDFYGWIMLESSKKKKIKGFLGNIPVDYRINGKIYHTVSASTWVVNPECRKYSIYLYFSYLKQNKDLFLNSTPADITNHIFTKTNFVDIAKMQNNYLNLMSYSPIYYLLKKLIKYNYLNIIISKFIFFSYQALFRIKLNNKKLNIKYEIVTSLVEIDKLLKKKKVQLINFDWVLKSDSNKYFLRILNRNKSNNFIYMQYVDSPTNNLKYIQVLETDVISANIIKNIILNVATKYNYSLDYIILCNSNINKMFYGPFIKFNFLSKSKCLIKSDKVNIKNIIPNGSFGEKGFVIWN